MSRYFFINKVLKKTINALRMNAMESKFTGFYGQKKDDKVLSECFEALKQHYKTQKKVKRFQILSQIQKTQQILNGWSNYTVQNRQHNQIIEFFINRSDMRIKEKVFHAIQKSRETDHLVQKNFYLNQMFKAFKR